MAYHPEDDANFCATCGREQEPGARFCPNCGAAADPTATGVVATSDSVYNASQSTAGGNGMAIASMILGIIAIVFAIIPLFGTFIAVPCIGVGLPLGGVSFYQHNKRGDGKGFAIAGLATNIVALVMVIGWWILVAIGVASNDW